MGLWVNEDLKCLRDRIRSAFEEAFAEPPKVDASDWLDGDSLELYVGKHYHEIIPLLDEELDAFPFFSLCSSTEGSYYLGGYLLYYLQKIELSREYYDPQKMGFLLGSPWFSMIGFLKSEENRIRLGHLPEVCAVAADVLNVMAETSGFEFDEDELGELRCAEANLRDA